LSNYNKFVLYLRLLRDLHLVTLRLHEGGIIKLGKLSLDFTKTFFEFIPKHTVRYIWKDVTTYRALIKMPKQFYDQLDKHITEADLEEIDIDEFFRFAVLLPPFAVNSAGVLFYGGKISELMSKFFSKETLVRVEILNRKLLIPWHLWAHYLYRHLPINHKIFMKFFPYIKEKFEIPKFIKIVEDFAQTSKCLKLKVGAILVVNGKVVAYGRNGHPTKTRLDHVCLRQSIPHGTRQEAGYCLHAEQSLLIKAHPDDLCRGVIYLTHCPCNTCTKLLLQAKVPFVIFKKTEYPELSLDMVARLGGVTKFFGVAEGQLCGTNSDVTSADLSRK